MRYWTYYWGNKQVTGDIKEFEETGVFYPLEYAAGSRFDAAGISVGDTLYILNWMDGALFVLGRMRVGEMYDRAEAERRFGDAVYDAPEHISAEPGTATLEVFDSFLPELDLDDIEFLAPDGSTRAPKRNDRGEIEPQSFRNVREVTAGTASLFDSILGFDPQHDSGAARIRRRVTFLVELRDDSARRRSVWLNSTCSSTQVIERWIELERSVDDRTLLDDRDRFGGVVSDMVNRWADGADARVEDALSDLQQALDDAFSQPVEDRP